MKDYSGYIDCPKCGVYESYLAVDVEIGYMEGGSCDACGFTVNSPQWLDVKGSINKFASGAVYYDPDEILSEY